MNNKNDFSTKSSRLVNFQSGYCYVLMSGSDLMLEIGCKQEEVTVTLSEQDVETLIDVLRQNIEIVKSYKI